MISAAQAVRINLVETRLRSAGYQLNPLSSVLLTAPTATVLLGLAGLATDREITWKMLQALWFIGFKTCSWMFYGF